MLVNAQLKDGKRSHKDKNFHIDLRGVNFTAAWFQWTDLSGINFHRANLWSAKFQRADLSLTKLQGANLANAELQGTNLKNVDFQGARLENINFSYSNITDTKFGLLDVEGVKELKKTMANRIKSTQLLESIANTMIENILENSQSNQIPVVYGQDVWNENRDRVPIARIITKDANPVRFPISINVVVAKDRSDYVNKLMTYLISLSCQDPWVAAGITKNRIDNYLLLFDEYIPKPIVSSFAPCLLSLKDKKNQTNKQLVCPAMSEIDKDTVAILETAAAGKNGDSTIQPTFVCQTSLSDRDQPSE